MVIRSYKKLWGKKGAGQGGYDDIIRYLRISIKQVKPNKKWGYRTKRVGTLIPIIER